MNLLRHAYRTWFTGIIYIFAAFGYIFYATLFIYRMLTMKKLVLIFSIAIVLCAGFLFYFFVPLKQGGKEVSLIVEPGTSVRTVARFLEEHSVVPNERLFLIWVRLNKLEKVMQAGLYTFSQHEGIVSAANKLRQATPIEKSVTIPEGHTIEQTAQAIVKVFPIDSAEFVQLCNDSSLIATLGVEQETLEGYLFPNTYRFRPKANAHEIIQGMVKQFLSVYNSIEQTELSRNFSRHEIITLASIVEKEAMVPQERTHIAGVFHNRLRKHWPLGADPTVRYAIKKFSGPLRVSELKNKSPYNTRVHAGLPPGPICSPGKGAIEAAIAPLQTKDLYFVAKWDGSGTHTFSKTNAEHDRKKMEIRRRNQRERRKKRKG